MRVLRLLAAPQVVQQVPRCGECALVLVVLLLDVLVTRVEQRKKGVLVCDRRPFRNQVCEVGVVGERQRWHRLCEAL